MVRFENIWAFNWILLLVVLVGLFILYMLWRKRVFKNYSEDFLIGENFKQFSNRRHWIKHIIFSFGLLAIIAALANLQLGGKLKEGKSKCIELMIALDVSKSMLAEDIEPNRLSHAKLGIDRLLKRLKGDQIGVVVFAGSAYVQVPITSDYSAVKSFLQAVEPGMIPIQGTSFKAAINTCSEAFKSDSKSSKAIVIITDGENHEEGAEEAAQEALESGIRIYTIGMGGTKGVPIPLKKGRSSAGYLKDITGNTVITALNPEVLSDIAESGGGQYLSAKNTQSSLNALFQEIKRLDQQDFNTKVYVGFEDRFQFFLLPGIFLIMLSITLWERKSKWI